MLHTGASHCTRILQKYRWPSWQLGFQPPPPEHTRIAHRRCPWGVCPHPHSPRLLLMTIRHLRFVSVSAQTHPRRLNARGQAPPRCPFQDRTDLVRRRQPCHTHARPRRATHNGRGAGGRGGRGGRSGSAHATGGSQCSRARANRRAD